MTRIPQGGIEMTGRPRITPKGMRRLRKIYEEDPYCGQKGMKLQEVSRGGTTQYDTEIIPRTFEEWLQMPDLPIRLDEESDTQAFLAGARKIPVESRWAQKVKR
jgi:hypothetical protein